MPAKILSVTHKYFITLISSQLITIFILLYYSEQVREQKADGG